MSIEQLRCDADELELLSPKDFLEAHKRRWTYTIEFEGKKHTLVLKKISMAESAEVRHEFRDFLNENSEMLKKAEVAFKRVAANIATEEDYKIIIEQEMKARPMLIANIAAVIEKPRMTREEVTIMLDMLPRETYNDFVVSTNSLIYPERELSKALQEIFNAADVTGMNLMPGVPIDEVTQEQMSAIAKHREKQVEAMEK